MKPIWYFIGLLLTIVGVIVTITGIYYYFNPGDQQTILGEIHPDIWWGAVMLITGIIFFIKNRNVTVDENKV